MNWKTADKSILLMHGHPDNPGGIVHMYRKMAPFYAASDYRIHRLRSGRIQNRRSHNNLLIRLLDLVSNYIVFTTTLLRIRPALFHTNPSLNVRSIYREFGYIWLLLRFSPKTRILIHFRGWDSDFWKKFEKKRLLRKLTQYVIGNADSVIVLANRFKQELGRLPISPANIHVISNPVTLDAYPNNIRAEPGQELSILFLSRVVAAKGVFELIKGFSQLVHRNDIPPMRLIIAGDGEDRARAFRQVKRLGIEQQVFFPGYVRGKEKMRLLFQGDIFVLPSYSEGCPNAVLEAMAASLPIVSTNAGCLTDLIENGVNGFLVRRKSVEDITSAIRYLAENPELRTYIGKNNREKAVSEFGTERVFHLIEQIYASVMRNFSIRSL